MPPYHLGDVFFLDGRLSRANPSRFMNSRFFFNVCNLLLNSAAVSFPYRFQRCPLCRLLVLPLTPLSGHRAGFPPGSPRVPVHEKSPFLLFPLQLTLDNSTNIHVPRVFPPTPFPLFELDPFSIRPLKAFLFPPLPPPYTFLPHSALQFSFARFTPHNVLRSGMPCPSQPLLLPCLTPGFLSSFGPGTFPQGNVLIAFFPARQPPCAPCFTWLRNVEHPPVAIALPLHVYSPPGPVQGQVWPPTMTVDIFPPPCVVFSFPLFFALASCLPTVLFVFLMKVAFSLGAFRPRFFFTLSACLRVPWFVVLTQSTLRWSSRCFCRSLGPAPS